MDFKAMGFQGLLFLGDGGHGRFTAGRRVWKQFDPNETREWELNSRIVEEVEDRLDGYENVIFMRLDDPTGKRDVPLAERARRANELYREYTAKGYLVILLSVHHNAGINGGSGGGLVMLNDSRVDKNRPLSLRQESTKVRDRIYDEVLATTGLRGNRSKPKSEQPLYILYNTVMRGTLGEFGFMDSPEDARVITTPEHPKRCADGIVNYLVRDYGISKKAVKPAPKPVDDSKDYGYVTADVLNVRSGRSTGHKVVTQLKKGDKVEKLYLAKGWWSIAVPLSVDKRGYAFVSAAYIANIAPNQPKYQEGVVIPDRGLNVRKGPGTRYGIVKALRKGEAVTIYEEKSGWYRIGTHQWVSATFIKK